MTFQVLALLINAFLGLFTRWICEINPKKMGNLARRFSLYAPPIFFFFFFLILIIPSAFHLVVSILFFVNKEETQAFFPATVSRMHQPVSVCVCVRAQVHRHVGRCVGFQHV